MNTSAPAPSPDRRELLKKADLDGYFRRKSAADASSSTDLTQEELARQLGLNRSTLYRWRKRAKMGTEALFDRRRDKSGRRVQLSKRVQAWIFCYMADYPKASLADIAREAAMAAERNGWGEVSYRQVCGLMKRTPRDVRGILQDGFRATYERDALVCRRNAGFPLEMVQCDAKELDVWCFSRGQYFKPWCTSVIDCHTRVILALVVHRKEPTTVDALKTVQGAILGSNRPEHPFGGVFKKIQTDGHSTYQAADFLDAMRRMDIDWDPTGKASPSQNGKVERFFRTAKQRLLKNLRGYTDRHAALYKATKGKQALPFDLLQKLVDRFLVTYHTSNHAGLGGASPWEKWFDNIDTAHGQVYDAREIRKACVYRAVRTLQQEGVELEPGRFFLSPECAGLVGEEITVLLPVEGSPTEVEAFHKGKPIGILKCTEDADVAQAIDKARLARIEELRAFRRDMREAASHGIARSSHEDPEGLEEPADGDAEATEDSPQDPPETGIGDVPELPKEEDES